MVLVLVLEGTRDGSLEGTSEDGGGGRGSLSSVARSSERNVRGGGTCYWGGRDDGLETRSNSSSTNWVLSRGERATSRRDVG